MKYSDDVVEKVVARLLSGEVSQRELARVVGIPRATIGRWFRRKLTGFPARLKRAAIRVWNKTVQPVLDRLYSLLEQGKSAMLSWCEVGKTCLRTVQRYKKAWFPRKAEPRVKSRRYERRHALSLVHTDWAVKRILGGVRCCFSFYEDDATRKLFALKAYPKATLINTLDNLQHAKKQTHGFKAVLSDNGKVYLKNYDAQLHGIQHLKTRIHNPKCNGKAEAVVKKVKKYLNQFEVQNLEHANQILSRYQREYNNTPHSGLKYRTPNQVFKDKQKNGAISTVT
ncbi:MAG: DDE-type integrase/transposase/recombinase [Candidatus Diapherotrites archaeon]|nr:DDE-type integrase/transposase/recombinase [Candidatus Diapherotrites archaeon]